MALRIGINGLGRIGRLALRAAHEDPDVEVTLVNEPAGDAATAAHLLKFDTTHGISAAEIVGEGNTLSIDDHPIHYASEYSPEEVGWSRHVDVVVECSGRFRSRELLQPYLDEGVGHVIVSAPVKDDSIPNIVVGVNDKAFDPGHDRLVSGASCTTNCVAPVVKVLHERFGVVRGSINTVHAITASQEVVDAFHDNLRTGRAAFNSLIPAATGAAQALGRIFPELAAHVSGLSVRAPLTCPSLSDCTFEIRDAANVEQINAAMQAAAAGELAGILGYEQRPLVSVDYIDDTRSSVVDAPSTLVVDDQHVKVLAWYDNELAFAHRLVDISRRVLESR